MNKKLSLTLIALLIGVNISLETKAANNNTKALVSLHNMPTNNSLEKFFDNRQIKLIDDYQNSFNKIKTAKDLNLVYKRSEVLATDLNKKLITISNPNIDDFKWLKQYLSGLSLSYGAEAQSIYLTTNYKDFIKKSQLTHEVSDDMFLNLMINAFGDSGRVYPSWFVMTWDYGGYSDLGNDKHFHILEKINKTMLSSPEFKDQIMEVRRLLINDIVTSNNYGYPSKNVIREIKKIISNKFIKPTEKMLLEKRINEIKSGQQKFQFNCVKAKCSYG
ncbi:MAG: hypothetical protein H7263_02120 [Candidatus Sericytochromatia bacterium]|nr:hypothetical protein [Candidatus Sericytochromatia bacterium]